MKGGRYVTLAWVFLALSSCFFLEGTRGSQLISTTTTTDDDSANALYDDCSNDIALYCPTATSTTAQLSCLYTYEDQVSPACQSFLTTTTPGGCNTDAQVYCSQYTTVDDISNCLDEKSTSLSINCYRNIHNYSGKLTQEQSRIRRMTQLVSVAGMFLLAIPVIAVILMYRRVQEIQILDQEVLSTSPSHLLPLSLGKAAVDLESRAEDSIGNSQAEEAEDVNRGGWCISFHELAYYAYEPFNVLQPLQTRKKKAILNKVSGQLDAGKVTAIMGPSGSGKTTLLKLLGGQMFSGEFHGLRAINDYVPQKTAYDQLLRQQGFVSQYDGFLSTMTVWETLKYSALLRLPSTMTMKQKLYRAAHIMHVVDIAHIASCELGSLTPSSVGGNNLVKGISGGQRRRLAIASEILPNPSIILLDEPTSGLDGASTLKIVSTLRDVSRRSKTTIALTIHQPRSEVFDLFDSLVLLGTGGHLVYYGPTHHAAAILSLAPALAGRGPVQYENPGDFIIDCLGLTDDVVQSDKRQESMQEEREEEKVLMTEEASSQRSLIAERNISSLTSAPAAVSTGEKNSLTMQLAEYFRTTEAYQLLLSQLQAVTTSTPPTATAAFRTASTRSTADSFQSKPYTSLSAHGDGIELTSNPISDFSVTRQVGTASSNKSYFTVKKSYPTSFWDQVVILFARRKSAFGPSPNTVAMHVVQIFLIAIIVTAAFSYHVSTDLELPYQVVLILSMISLYAMILQYLHILPIYLVERQSLLTDTMSGYVSNACYVMAATLTEVPVALVQCSILLIAMYSVHSLNPDVVRQQFTVVCLMIGVVSFQALLTICSVLTDSMEVAYSITFMVLSSGTIFGGFLIRLEKIIPPFQIVYFTAVNAITQRALVANDLSCCYLTTTCNEYIDSITDDNSGANTGNSTYVCPTELEFSGDGSDTGNLGQMYVMALNLRMDTPFAALVALLGANLLFRAIAYWILQFRLTRKDRLAEVTPP